MQDVEQGIVLQPSPLLVEEVDYINLHFEVNPVRSAWLPPGAKRKPEGTGSWVGPGTGASGNDGCPIQNFTEGLPDRAAMGELFGNGFEIHEPKLQEANRWLSQNAAPQKPLMKEEYQEKLVQREQASRSKAYVQKVEKAAKKSADWGNTKSLKTPSKSDSGGILSVSPFMPLGMMMNCFL